MLVRAKMVTFAVFTGVLLITSAVIAANIVVVSQNHRAFAVPAMEIPRGGTLRFTNDDKFVHQIYVASPAMSFESDEQPPGANVEISFLTAGTFVVLCHIHPKMHLEVETH